MSDETRQAVQRYADAWIRCDPQLLAASLGVEATLYNPRLGDLDRQRIITHLERLLEGFPDVAFALDGPMVVEGDRAAYRWVMTGTNLGEFYGRPATGNTVTLPGADFLDVKGGLVARVIEYSDTAGFAEQLAGSG